MQKKLLKYIFLLFPFLDLITSLITNYTNFSLTPGTVIRGAFLLYLVIFLYFSNSRYRKLSLNIIAFSTLYAILYFITKIELLSLEFLLNELIYMFKLLYFPFIFLGLLCFFDTFEFDKKEITFLMQINLIIFVLFLIIPLLTNTAFDTYIGKMEGSKGWFYSGNQISNVMVLLSPFMFDFINCNKNKYSFLIALPTMLVMFAIGTKVSFFGLYIVVILYFLFSLFEIKKTKKYVYASLILIICIIFSLNSPTIDNVKVLPEITEQEIVAPSAEAEEGSEEWERFQIWDSMNNFFEANSATALIRTLLSNRDQFIVNTINIYNQDLDSNKVLFGIGFSNTKSINNPGIEKLIEIDLLDIFFRQGVIGLLIMLSPLLITTTLIIKAKAKGTKDSFFYGLIIFLAFGISVFSGHVFLIPSVIFYIVIFLLLLLNEFKIIGRKNELKEKITILSLHMGYGGIERTIVNQANMMSQKHEVEIVCLYKLGIEIPYEIDKRVKLIYLSNLKPNKEEFYKYLNNKNLFKTFIEGIKSLYILYMKYNLIKRFIYKSDSKIIISTRIEFTSILNIYANPKAIKIAEEHVYHHNNKKYINKLTKSLTNIDYLIPASQYLTQDYKQLLKKDLKIKYIPHTIDFLPKKTNKCDNFNIISVGRLSKEKGYKDLIEVFKLINKENNQIKLTIAGDGPQMKDIKSLINGYNLQKNIILKGFLNQEELRKEYSKASLYLMCSHEESFGLVLIEAMSYGIPCFAFDSALGAKEIINNKNGLLIKNRDYDQMAKEVLEYFKLKNKNKYITNARETVSVYTKDNVTKKWLDFICEIIKNSKGE